MNCFFEFFFWSEKFVIEATDCSLNFRKYKSNSLTKHSAIFKNLRQVNLFTCTVLWIFLLCDILNLEYGKRVYPKHNFEKLFIQLNLTYSFLPLTNKKMNEV